MSNVKTRLAEAYTASCSTCTKVTDDGFSYTVRGELTTFYEATPHSAGYYSVPVTYWANGLIKTFGPFVGIGQISYTPDGEGRMYSMGGGGVPSISYNAAGQPTQVMTSCNGATCYPMSFSYDANTLRMNQYSAAVVHNSTNYTISGTLTWNPNGGLQQLVVSDPLNANDNQTCNYTADDLGRIASVTCGTGWSQTFSYDPFGNITKSGSISWMPGYYQNTNHYMLAGTSYDSDGNVLRDGSNTNTFDPEGKIISTLNGASWGFTYDALGHMVETSINGAYSRSLVTLGKYKLSAVGQQTGAYSEYPLPGGGIRSFNGGGTGFNFPDWLGTIRGFYSYTGGGYGQSGAHAPFGESYGYSGGYPADFTGQSNDGSMQNTTYWFPERHFRSSQGRWISPDPLGVEAADPRDPQTWNRYAYLANRPLNQADPLGLAGCEYLDGAFQGQDSSNSLNTLCNLPISNKPKTNCHGSTIDSGDPNDFCPPNAHFEVDNASLEAPPEYGADQRTAPSTNSTGNVTLTDNKGEVIMRTCNGGVNIQNCGYQFGEGITIPKWYLDEAGSNGSWTFHGSFRGRDGKAVDHINVLFGWQVVYRDFGIKDLIGPPVPNVFQKTRCAGALQKLTNDAIATMSAKCSGL